MKRLLLFGLLVSATAAPAGVGGTGVTGSPAAISLERQAAAAYSNYPAVETVDRGVFSYETGATGYRWAGWEAVPAGFHAATLDGLWLVDKGRVREVVFQAHAAGLPRLILIEDASGLWEGLADRRGYCYSRARDFIDQVGKPIDVVQGDFDPPTQDGAVDVIHFTYARDGGTASGTDRISAASHALLSSTIVVAGATPATHFRDEQTVRLLTQVPEFVLAPGPTCTR